MISDSLLHQLCILESHRPSHLESPVSRVAQYHHHWSIPVTNIQVSLLSTKQLCRYLVKWFGRSAQDQRIHNVHRQYERWDQWRHGFPTSPQHWRSLSVEKLPQRAHDDPNLLLMINCMHYLAPIREFLRLQWTLFRLIYHVQCWLKLAKIFFV
jgi:hypothetical protein